MRSRKSIASLVIAVSVCSNLVLAQMDTISTQTIAASGAQWAWPDASGDGPNQYMQYIHDFDLPQTTAPTRLAISADTNYAVWLNGSFAGFGQWSDYPNDKTFDNLDLTPHVRPGTNRLCVLVWYQGQSSHQYLKGAPGLLFAVVSEGKSVAASGPATRMRTAPDYVSGSMPRVTVQLSFTFEHRADRQDNWLQPGYNAGAWALPAAGDLKPLDSRTVRPRPVAKLKLADRLPMRVLSQGVFTRTGAPPTPAMAMQTDALAFRQAGDLYEHPQSSLPDAQSTGLRFKNAAWKDATGPYVVLDTGREEAGLLEIEIDSPPGTIVDIGYGEHLEDLRVRTHIGGRNFANRQVCAAGRHTFLHPFLRAAGRYVQLHITPPTSQNDQPITLHYAGIRPTEYPVAPLTPFDCPDSLHERIREISARSLHLCMHEHFEDCPWREQAMYGMDGRNQALAGYYCFGNYDFAAASIDLLGKGLKPDGFLEMCAPGDIHITIPSFSLAWILMVDDYLMFSGDREFARRQLPIARTILATCAKESSGPVIATPRGRRMWNFYEWAPGLDGSDASGFENVAGVRYEAPLNLFYLLALDAAARVSRECGENGDEFAAKARDLRPAMVATFWSAKDQAFVTKVGPAQAPHFAELTQALAILAGAVPDGELPALRERLARDHNGLVPCTISHTLYKFEALLTDKERYAPRVFELIKRDWGYMLAQGATSFWETIDGASAFGNAGSLCHGWSGIPAWFYGAWILGVRPSAPGFADYTTDPAPGAFDWVKGRVPTPRGLIDVNWRTENGKLTGQAGAHKF